MGNDSEVSLGKRYVSYRAMDGRAKLTRIFGVPKSTKLQFFQNHCPLIFVRVVKLYTKMFRLDTYQQIKYDGPDTRVTKYSCVTPLAVSVFTHWLVLDLLSILLSLCYVPFLPLLTDCQTEPSRDDAYKWLPSL